MSKNSGIYIHFPFCNIKCGYCDFYSIVDRKDSIPNFIESIVKEIDLFFRLNDLNKLNFDTIFLGGGTPHLLNLIILRRYLKHYLITLIFQ